MFLSTKESVLNKALYKYDNPIEQRGQIRKDNDGKPGIYMWVNNVNGKIYVGSGIYLYKRITDYYRPWYFKSRTSLYILRAILKYGLINFSLVILEHTDPNNLIMCEQKWMDLLKPEYNLNPVAGSSKGYEHTPESIAKMKNRLITEETKLKMSESAKGRLKWQGKQGPFEGKKHSEKSLDLLRAIALNRTKLHKAGVEVEVTDLETKLTVTYESIRKAAKAINSDIKSLSRREKSQLEKGINTPYRKRYMIVFNRF